MFVKLKNITDPIKVDSLVFSKISNKYKVLSIYVKDVSSDEFDKLDQLFRTPGALDLIETITDAGVTESFTIYTVINDINRRVSEFSNDANIRLCETGSPQDLK